MSGGHKAARAPSLEVSSASVRRRGGVMSRRSSCARAVAWALGDTGASPDRPGFLQRGAHNTGLLWSNEPAALAGLSGPARDPAGMPVTKVTKDGSSLMTPGWPHAEPEVPCATQKPAGSVAQSISYGGLPSPDTCRLRKADRALGESRKYQFRLSKRILYSVQYHVHTPDGSIRAVVSRAAP